MISGKTTAPLKVRFEAIPVEMREYRHWIVWRYVQRKGGPKPTKVPFDPVTDGPPAPRTL